MDICCMCALYIVYEKMNFYSDPDKLPWNQDQGEAKMCWCWASLFIHWETVTFTCKGSLLLHFLRDTLCHIYRLQCWGEKWVHKEPWVWCLALGGARTLASSSTDLSSRTSFVPSSCMTLSKSLLFFFFAVTRDWNQGALALSYIPGF